MPKSLLPDLVARDALRASEMRYRRLFETARDGILLLNADSAQIEDVNPYLVEKLGYSKAEFLGKKLWEVGAFADRAESKEMFAELQATGYVRYDDLPLRTKTGSQLEVEFVSNVYDCDGIKIIQCNIRDITERKAAEARSQRHIHLYYALSHCNKAILHCDSEEDLFQRVCEAAVKFGSMKFSWIGIVDAKTSMVRPAASFGEGAEILQELQVSVDAQNPLGRGPTGTAIRENRPFWCNDLRTDPGTLPWRERVARAGWVGVASLPLHRNGHVVGAFVVYAGEANAFDEYARDLLGEMAADISFALDNFARESQRRQAEEAARINEDRLRLALRNINMAVFHQDRTLRYTWMYRPQLGYSIEQIVGRTDAELLPPESARRITELKQRVIEKGEIVHEEVHVALNDKTVFFDLTAEPLREASGAIIGLTGVTLDVTERKQAERLVVESETRFRGLVEQAIAGIYIIQDGKLAYVNPRTAEIIDQGSTDDLIGTDPLVWVAETDRSQVAESIRRLLEGEAKSLALDFGVLRRDGVVIQVGANAAYAMHKGRPAIIGLLQDISERRRAEEEIRQYVAQLEAAFMSTVEVATIISEMRDPYTAGHEHRVAEIAVAIGAELGFDARRQEGLRVAGHLHDIGKITIPSEILSKPGKLSAIELQLIRTHAQASHNALKDVKFPWPVAQIALQHHERMDGSGYPLGLKGDAILLDARIMAVADVVEAMSSHRPYRPGLGIEKALAEIERGRGKEYDGDAADACLRLFREGRYQLPA